MRPPSYRTYSCQRRRRQKRTAPPDFELKLARATSHLDDLEFEIEKWADSEGNTISRKFDPKRREEVVSVKVIDPPADPISVLIGDCLFALRSGLDQLAYALASAYTEPLPTAIGEASEFPIFGDQGGRGSAEGRPKKQARLRGWPLARWLSR